MNVAQWPMRCRRILTVVSCPLPVSHELCVGRATGSFCVHGGKNNAPLSNKPLPSSVDIKSASGVNLVAFSQLGHFQGVGTKPARCDLYELFT